MSLRLHAVASVMLSPEVLPSDNHREHPRHALSARCWIDDGRHTLYVRIHDVSHGGISVRAPVPFKPSGNVDLELELPHGRVKVRAEVVWVRDATGGTGARMGARFLEVSEGKEALALALQNPKR